MQLRDYQTEAVQACYNHLRTREDNPCIVIPTGGGKTPVLAQICLDASPEWAAKRRYVLKRDGCCRVCGGPAQQVHHLTYARVKPPNFSELMSDLIAVCVPCHEEIHS